MSLREHVLSCAISGLPVQSHGNINNLRCVMMSSKLLPSEMSSWGYNTDTVRPDSASKMAVAFVVLVVLHIRIAIDHSFHNFRHHPSSILHNRYEKSLSFCSSTGYSYCRSDPHPQTVNIKVASSATFQGLRGSAGERSVCSDRPPGNLAVRMALFHIFLNKSNVFCAVELRQVKWTIQRKYHA